MLNDSNQTDRTDAGSAFHISSRRSVKRWNTNNHPVSKKPQSPLLEEPPPDAPSMEVSDIAGNPMIRSALGDSFPASPQVTIHLCREAGVDADSHVLHLGTGVGTVCEMLAETFDCEVTGIVELEDLMRYVKDKNPRVHFIQAALDAPPCTPGSFSHVLIESRCLVLPELGNVLAAARAMLKPGGILIVNEPVVGENKWVPATISTMILETQMKDIVLLRTAAMIRTEIDAAGFTIDRSKSESEVTERIVRKLDQISMMLKMAIRLYRFEPKKYGIPFSKRDILVAFDEIRDGIRDGTFCWHSWRATAF